MPRIESIYDLPSELFDAIIEECVGYLPITTALSSPSLVSKRFRHAAIAILFRCVSITLTNAERRHGETLLDFLLRNPHIRHCIHTIKICKSAGEATEQAVEYQKLKELLPLLPGLRNVELFYSHEANLDLLRWIASLKRQPNVAITAFSLRCFSDAHYHETVEAFRALSSIRYLSFCADVPAFVSGGRSFTYLENVQRVMSICQNLVSLDLVVPPQRTVPLKRERPEFSHFSLNGTTASCLPPLKELRLNVNPRRIMVQEDDCLNLLAGFQWSSIEKLDISSDRLTETLLPRFGAEMVKLQSLSIIVLYLKQNGLWAASEQSLLAVSDLLAKRSFAELELDGFNKTLPIRHVASVHLRKLRLHMIELDHTIARANLRSAAEIQELAELAPNLEHLMLDVAHVGKLWHPSAIPGVDVNVHLYQVLGAFSKFRHLKTLRLFPRYYCADENGQGLWQQAIDDDGQAVRIFKYLKSISPSLELLVLSSDHLVAQFADIDPMSWTVCQFGDCILLRLQQANKNYEQKQIWQGQRRLRTEIKRYSHSKLRWTS